jgi:hypothetical protein
MHGEAFEMPMLKPQNINADRAARGLLGHLPAETPVFVAPQIAMLAVEFAAQIAERLSRKTPPGERRGLM